MRLIKLYIGFDPREELGWHVFTSSVIEHTTAHMAFIPINAKRTMRNCKARLPSGSNDFTFSRFLIPWMESYSGPAIFADGCDMLCKGDIEDLFELYDSAYAVQVVKHDYKTRHARKYVSTEMECDNNDYARKNWASLMLINCGHKAWQQLRPETIGDYKKLDLLQLRFIADADIGELPEVWNWLADEFHENANAKLLHFTAGIPGIHAYRATPGARHWFAQLDTSNTVPSAAEKRIAC